MHAEAQVLAIAHRREVAELASGRKQCHLRVAEPERCETAQLLAEVERQLRAARQDRVDDGRRHQVVRRQQSFSLRRKASANGSMNSGRIDRPAAARCPPNRSRNCAHPRSAPCRSNDAIDRPSPSKRRRHRQAARPAGCSARPAARRRSRSHPRASPHPRRRTPCDGASPPATPRPARSPRARSCFPPPVGRGSSPRAGRRGGALRQRPRSAGALAPRADARAARRH